MGISAPLSSGRLLIITSPISFFSRLDLQRLATTEAFDVDEEEEEEAACFNLS
jgi:hypothetical protein